VSTRSELREAYTDLATLAPTRRTLRDPRARPRRRPTLQIVAVAVAAIVLIVVPAALIQQHLRSGSSGAAGPPNSSVTFPTEFWFGPQSLPGFVVVGSNLSPEGQEVTYTQKSTGIHAVVDGFVATAATDAKLAKGTPVKIGAIAGHFLAGDSASFTSPSVAWQFSPGRWAQFTVSKTKKDSQGQSQDVALPVTQTLAIAATLTPRADANVALVKIGYLPASLQFNYASEYLKQGQMLSPDGTVGTGYRDISFVDRKQVAAVDGSVSAVNHSTLDIVTVAQPYVPLATATRANLPSFNGNGPWTKTTVAGHLAWVSPHAVLIQWGDIQIGLASTRIEGDDRTHLLSRAELLKIANSLSDPAGTEPGQGHPLVSALPDGSLG
jgi:hypothetical protein